MRRQVIGLLLLLCMVSTASAVVQGYPDSANITGFFEGTAGTASVDGTALNTLSLPYSLSNATRPGDAHRFFLDAVADWVEVEFLFDSPQYGYTNGPLINLAVYLGYDATHPAVESGGYLFLAGVYWDTGSGYGSLSAFSSYPQAFLNATSAQVDPTTLYFSISNAPSDLVQGVKLRFQNLNVAGSQDTYFWLAAIQNPEPGTLALFGFGLAGAGLFIVRRRRNKKA